MKKLRFIVSITVSLITEDNDYQCQPASAAQEAAVCLGVVQARDGGADGILVESAGRTGFPKVARAAVAAAISGFTGIVSKRLLPGAFRESRARNVQLSLGPGRRRIDLDPMAPYLWPGLFSVRVKDDEIRLLARHMAINAVARDPMIRLGKFVGSRFVATQTTLGK
jgi:hypothetical protein